MENYSYPTSYPESGDSSPRSREIDFENTASWDEQSNSYKVKFMCSYGGKIHPRPHDNQLSYSSGETKILAVERNIKFASLIAKLSDLCDADVNFKYQLPGEDLDALISVTNDNDLEHMMQEYDRLFRASSKPARLRLFLFAVSQTAPAPAGRFGSGEEKSDRERFVDALNSGPIQSSPMPSTVAPPSNVDLLFGIEKGMPQPPTVAARVHEPPPEPEIRAPTPEDRFIGADPIQRQIQDFQRMQLGGQEQQDMYKRRSDDNLVGFTGDYYVQKLPEKVQPATLPSTMPTPVSAPQGYWPEKHVAGGVYPATTPGHEQQVYMIPAPTGMYHTPIGRPVTNPAGQGYYAVQRMPPEAYRDQPPVYNVVPPAPAATAVAPQILPPQSQPKVTAFSEGFGMVRPTTVGGVGVMDTAYTAMAYDNGVGRQVYYPTPGGMVAPPPQYQAVAAAVSAEMRPAGALNQEGKATAKASQASV